MSLRHAILGFLSYSPLSGYDLKKAFDRSVAHFWPADQAQIYRSLQQMVSQGWVEVSEVEQTNRPTRKEYHLTPSGEAELASWLGGSHEAKPSREPFLVQLFFSGKLPKEEQESLLVRERQQVEERLRGLELLKSEVEPEVGEENFFPLATLDNGIHMARAYLEWLERFQRELQER